MVGQELEFEEIKIVDDFKPPRNISLADTLKIKYWDTKNPRYKSRVKKTIKQKLIDLKNDTSAVLQILYYGSNEDVEIWTKDTLFLSKNLGSISKKYAYIINDFPSEDDTYEIGQLPRNSGIHKATVYFKKIRKFCHVEVDTEYSEVYLIPETDIELVEFIENDSIGQEKNGILKPSESRIVKREDRLSINYRIPTKKHSW